MSAFGEDVNGAEHNFEVDVFRVKKGDDAVNEGEDLNFELSRGFFRVANILRFERFGDVDDRFEDV